jgi:uncharacterized protein
MKSIRMSVLAAAVIGSILCVWVERTAGSLSLEGVWAGKRTISEGYPEISFIIQRNPDDTFRGTLVSPAEGVPETLFSRIGLKEGKATLEVSGLGIRYEGTISPDSSTLDGQWTRNGTSFALKMIHIIKPSRSYRPQEPDKPYPYVEEEVTYRNAADEITLSGTLTIPRGSGPFPTALLISGSGPNDRDETICDHRPFFVLADSLTRRGIAVLRVDSRGVGGSTGSVANATGEDLARDVLAGLAFLKTRKEVDPNHLGLISHGEGGIVASLVAVRSPDVSFIVQMAGTGLPGDQVIEGRGVHSLKESPATDQAVIDDRLIIARRIFAIAKQETDLVVLKQKMREALSSYFAGLHETQTQALANESGHIDDRVEEYTSAWFRFFVAFDPRPTLQKIRCPVLAISGEFDSEVLTDDNLPEIEKTLKAGGNADVTVRKLASLNHLLQTARTGNMGEYKEILETISPVALETIGKWIEAHAQKR